MHGNVALIEVKTGVIKNIIVVDESFISPPGYTTVPINGQVVFIGDVWDGKNFAGAQGEKELESALAPTAKDIEDAEFELKLITKLTEWGIL